LFAFDELGGMNVAESVVVRQERLNSIKEAAPTKRLIKER